MSLMLSDIRFVKNGYVLSPSSAGIPGDEDYDMALIRDHWVDRQLSSHREAYSQRQTLRCVPSVALPPVADLS